jgi:hypothetical protein
MGQTEAKLFLGSPFANHERYNNRDMTTGNSLEIEKKTKQVT